MTSLFHLSEELVTLDQDLSDILEREDLRQDQKDELANQLFDMYLTAEESVKDKILGVCAYIKEQEALSKARKEEARRITELAKYSTNKAERMRAYVTKHMERLEMRKVEGPNSSVSLRKLPDVMEIHCDPEELPEPYKKVQVSANKTAIKNAIKQGYDLDFVSIEPSNAFGVTIR